jgi:N-acetylmuramoyl-L-alanine amidase
LTIVVDAAHGGADDGARGANGLKEKDVVLALARGCRAELTQRGYRVVLTRDGDSDPSFDDRAAIANQFANVFFVTLHVASTGTPSTVRVYYDRIAAPYTMPPSAAGSSPAPDPRPQSTPTASPTQIQLLPWRQAQTSFDDASHRFADLVQAALAQKFSGSPANSVSASVRDLRSVATPAIAIEISNIGSPNVSTLESMSPSIAEAIAQAVAVLRPSPNANNGANGAGATP